jgi:pimeloyl-ACP methyl ester carboxylesterase
MRTQAPCFKGRYQYQEVPHAGHFLQREQSDAVNRLLLAWLASFA